MAGTTSSGRFGSDYQARELVENCEKRRALVCADCCRRVRFVFRPPGQKVWACSRCHSLSYSSQRFGPSKVAAVARDDDLYQTQLDKCQRLYLEVAAISDDYEHFFGPKARELTNAQETLARAGQLRILAAKREQYRAKKGADLD